MFARPFGGCSESRRGDKAAPRARSSVSAPLRGAWLCCWRIPGSSPPCSPRVPACSPSPMAPLMYLFLHAELSSNPEPWASSGRGSRGSPASPAAVPEYGVNAQPCFCKVSRFTLPSASLPLSLSSPLSFSVGCFKEKKIYGSGSKSCFPCPGASRCTLLAGSALPSLCPAPQLLHLTQKIDHVTLHLLPPGPQTPELVSASLNVPGTCSSLRLLRRIKFPFHIPTLGKM